MRARKEKKKTAAELEETKQKYSPCAKALKKVAWRLRGLEGKIRHRLNGIRLWHRFAEHVRKSVLDASILESKEEEPSGEVLLFSTPPAKGRRRSAGSSIKQYRPVPRSHLAPGSPDIHFCSQDGSVVYTNLQKASDEWVLDHKSELHAVGQYDLPR